MTETNSQLGELLREINRKLYLKNLEFRLSDAYPRKFKKKLKKSISLELKQLELQRKSLIENYI